MQLQSFKEVNMKFDPLNDGKSSLEVIQQCGSDKMIVNAARVSYAKDVGNNFTDKDAKLIKYLIDHRHTSPLEHSMLTIKVKLPLNIGEQWLRHRMASYNKQSGRYIDLSEMEPDFYHPYPFRKQSENNRQASVEVAQSLGEHFDMLDPTGIMHYDWDRHCEAAMSLYRFMIDNGVAKEQARMILPQCTYMSMYATANLHSWLHFISLRDKPDAQWEIQQYAKCVREVIKKYWPVTLAAFDSKEGKK